MVVFELVNVSNEPVLVQGLILKPMHSVKVSELGDGTEDKILQGLLTCSPPPYIRPSTLVTSKTIRTLVLEEGQPIEPFKRLFVTDVTQELKDLESSGLISISPSEDQVTIGTFLPSPHMIYSLTKETIEV